MKSRESFGGEQEHRIEKYRDSLPNESLFLDQETINTLKQRIASDASLQKDIQESDASIALQRKHWKDMADEILAGREGVLLRDYLLQNPQMVARNAEVQSKVWSRQWPERIRLAKPEEIAFLKAAQEVGGNSFVEILKVSSFSAGAFEHSAAAVGSGENVSAEDVDEILETLSLDGHPDRTVILVHNHFDPYGETRGLDEHFSEKVGFVRVGGLSRQDIDLADKILAETLGSIGKVVMVAISERGLVYSYEGGSSQFRDWQNDK